MTASMTGMYASYLIAAVVRTPTQVTNVPAESDP